MQVLCCCNPSNEVGHIPLDAGIAAGLEIRRWEDAEGHRGVAFALNHQPVEVLSQIPGFQVTTPQPVPEGLIAGSGKKTWETSGKKKKPKSKTSGSPDRKARILPTPKARKDKNRK